MGSGAQAAAAERGTKRPSSRRTTTERTSPISSPCFGGCWPWRSSGVGLSTCHSQSGSYERRSSRHNAQALLFDAAMAHWLLFLEAFSSAWWVGDLAFPLLVQGFMDFGTLRVPA
jgi:hypothetical protein